MAKIKSLGQTSFAERFGWLEKELINDCSVYRSGRLQFLEFPQSPDGPEGVEGTYLRIDLGADPELGRVEKQSFALLVSRYDLLCFARQILDELDPRRGSKT